jgi:hypothetical protein
MPKRQEEKLPVTIVSACMRADGLPTFAITEVEVTREEQEEGVQYQLAYERLLDLGYEEPFVHFAPQEAPPFLFPSVRELLGLDSPALQPVSP